MQKTAPNAMFKNPEVKRVVDSYALIDAEHP
jgi:hypothetical protein